ncbi:MAG: S8 family serine peptidase [Ardenticatenaceae bacterium]|nr:S8 family serine peptidase [Ardenticatenaceae bacterium]
MRRKVLLVTLMLIALVVANAVAIAAEPAADASVFEGATAQPAGSGVVVQPKDAAGPAIYLVILNDVPLASYRGGIEGLAATNPSASGKAKLDASSPASQAYLAYLDGRRAASIAEANAAIGRSLDIAYEYKATVNGYAATMTPEEAATIAKLGNVKFVEREREFELQTDAGPAWIGAPGIWDGSATGDAGTKGEGIIVGVIDTGIDPWNPSFAATGGDGYTHTNPFGTGNYVGVCDPTNTSPPPGVVAYDPTFPCNDKLIGAWGYTSVSSTPRDEDGHGSHTASTAAGNYVEDTTVETPTDVYTATISGVAPHANIIAYAACCTNSALSAARDQALLDGVDVINYSIGADSPTGDPWADTEAMQWLAIRDAGIFVATSAGNNGPGDATVGQPGDLPWLTTVAAASHNRAFLQEITLDDGSGNPLTLSGLAMTSGLPATPIVFAADYADPPSISAEDARLCADGVFPPGTFSGEIVICERGTYGRVAKGQTVLDGGAGGYILAQPDEFGGGPGSLLADPHVLPAIHIDYYTYQALLDYMNAATGTVTGTIAGAVRDISDANGDVMAAFSSRGPNGGFFKDLIVPNVTAPGRDIWAAYHQGPGGDGDYTWNVISGTSMSSPHVAGSGALLKAAHPDWTPAQIESALMTTGVRTVINDDGVNTATPFAQGSGRVDLVAAVQAGLVLDVSTTAFEDSDPRTGGDPTTLNLAEMGNSSCVQSCSWTRTVESTLSAAETYTLTLDLPTGMTGSVTPTSFTIDPGASQTFTVTVNVLGLDESWHFGSLEITPAGASTPAQHMVIGVQPNTGDLPDLVNLQTRRDAGSDLVTGLTAIEITDLTVETYGLVKGTEYNTMLVEDPTHSDVYDDINGDGIFYTTVNVPADAKRLIAQVTESDAPDVDLYVGTGDTPSQSTEVCISATGAALEYCDITDPAAGTWWVLIQNWAASATPPDHIQFMTAVVPTEDAGNMTVTGPTAVAALDPFDLRIYWDEDMNAGEYWYGGFTLGTDAAHPGNIGYVPVNLQRIEDDVIKTVNTNVAMPGDTLTYTITIMPNVLGENLNYNILDTIPDGLTYVPGSATASDGSVLVGLDTLFWTGTMISPANAQPMYNISTPATDPMCDTGFGGYVNLEDFGIFTQASITGDTVRFTAFSSGNPFSFYGVDNTGVSFTDDGFAIFDGANNYGGSPWVPQALPDAALPNDVAAILWQDFEIFYDAALNHGVSPWRPHLVACPARRYSEYDDVS